MTATITETVVEESLTLHDRCDAESVPVQAHVRVRKDAKVLDFCKHHFERLELSLLAAGWAVTDDSRESLA